ncbi:MAG: sugar phosphorylase [Bryobacterales bacterium]
MRAKTHESILADLKRKVIDLLSGVYEPDDVELIADQLLAAMGLKARCTQPAPRENKWSEDDVLVITYGNSVVAPGEAPLATLRRFLVERLAGVVSGVHILPFCPFSSDDGFSVIDYHAVDPNLGDWSLIGEIAWEYDLMADLVLNHVSAESVWFENFKRGVDPGKDYFITADPSEDLSMVVRPRSSPLLTPVETVNGVRYVWSTFSADQVDLNFANPDVLVEIARVLRRYLQIGVRIFRLDAVAFLWKEKGTNCLHLPQTHRIIKLLRLLLEYREPDAIVVTETNVPNRENLSYFGDADEAHVIYNFSLAPLLLHTMISGDCTHLMTWLMSMPPALMGATFLNFIASHDGIGLRPAEGLLSDEELATLVETMKSFGGRVSTRRLSDGTEKPYELNIALWDALQGTQRGPDSFQERRFLCAHAVMLALEGIPSFYFHSLVAGGNDYAKLERTQHSRSINRRNWDAAELAAKLDNPSSHHSRVFGELSRLIRVRRAQPAFHPNATQYTLHLGPKIFGFWRQSIDRSQSIFAIHNVSDEPQKLSLLQVNLISTDEWVDLIGGGGVDDLDGEIVIEPYQAMWLTNKGQSLGA